MRTIALLVLAAGGCGIGLFARPVAGGVVDPHLKTDRSPDTRSARTIVADLVRNGQTDEAKAVAIFNWLRRVVFHSGPEEPMRHDFNLMINVFGYGSCYMQTHPLSHLYQQIGLPCRDWTHRGHHMMEVFYGGAWHCFDPHMTFYVRNRAKPPAIASVAELRADPTLAEKAKAEGRACPGYLLCGDKPKWFAGDDGWTLHRPFRIHRGADREFGAVKLPRGTRYVRTWMGEKFYQPHAFGRGKVEPYHTCGRGADRKDPVNWPYWEPYVRGGRGRHASSGFLDYQPDLRGAGWQDGAIRFFNLVGDAGGAGPALHPRAAGMPAEVIFAIRCPYIVTSASVKLAGRIGQAGGTLAVSVSKQWVANGSRRVWKDLLTVAEPGEVQRELDLTEAVAGSLEGYWLRVAMQAKGPRAAGLDTLKVHTDFQLNPYALPQLLPGKNKLTVTAGRTDVPWKVRVAWSEGDGWKTRKEYTAAIAGRLHEAVIEAAGPKLPRMEAIEFSVAP